MEERRDPPTWMFRVPKGSCSRVRAWARCVRAGRLVGIPDHAWGKDHGPDHWGYRTLSPEHIQTRARAMARRVRR